LVENDISKRVTNGQALMGRYRARHDRVWFAAVFIVMVVIGLLAMTGSRADEWTGFHGAERADHAAQTIGPLHWSPTNQIRWKVTIPGAGHSSPIVTEKSVYLTTGVALPVMLPWRTICGTLAVAFGLCFFVFGLSAVARESGGAPDLRQLAGLAGIMLLLLGVLFLLIFGEQIIDFDRSPERPWLGMALFGIFTLHLTGQFPARQSRAPLLAGLGLLAYTGVLALQAPMPGLWRAWPYDVQSIFYLTFIALAALAGLLNLGRFLAPAHPRAGRLLRGVAFAGIAAAGVWLLLAAAGQAADILQDVSARPLNSPPFPWWIVLPGALAFVAATIARRRAGNTRPANLAVAISAALFLATLIFAGFGWAAWRVPFITHLWGTPHWIPTPILGGQYWSLALGITLAAIIAGVGFTRVNGMAGQPAFARLLSVPLVVLFAVYSLLPLPPLVARRIVAIDRAAGYITWASKALVSPRGEYVPEIVESSPVTL